MEGPDPEVTAAIEERGNTVVFFDVTLGNDANAAELGRIKLELFVKDVSRKKKMRMFVTTSIVRYCCYSIVCSF
jgi:hypothetical protein